MNAVAALNAREANPDAPTSYIDRFLWPKANPFRKLKAVRREFRGDYRPKRLQSGATSHGLTATGVSTIRFHKRISMIHENLSQSIEDLRARMIAIRDSL